MAARIHESLKQLGEQIQVRPTAAEFDERIGSLRTELRRDLSRLEIELRENSRRRSDGIAELATRVTRLAEEREARTRESDAAAIARLQSSLGNWQGKLADHMKSRENWLVEQLREELQRLRAETWHWLGELHRTKVDRSEFESRLPRDATRPHPPPPWQPPNPATSPETP